MHSTTEFRKGENASVYWLTSTDLQRARFCFTLRLNEYPRMTNPTKLSEILEENADEKYNLSARACQGILNRAEKRGKSLPEILKTALESQAVR